MDTQKQPEKAKTRSVWKLIVVGVCTFVFGTVGLSVAFILYHVISTGHWSSLTNMIFSPPWRNRFYQGYNGWDHANHERAASIMRAGIADAEAAHAPDAELMQLHRSLSQRYYSDDDLERGDAEISKVIESCPANPSPGSLQADLLVHAYQDRAWANHDLWWKGRKASNGVADQEKCVELTEKYFGENSHDTILKIPTLAAIYAEVGEHEKAAKIMKRAIDAANTTNRDCAWFVYTMKARVDAVEHRYRDAVAAYRTAVPLAVPSQEQRPLSELMQGLRYGNGFPAPPPPESTALFNKSLFNKIEQQASQLRQSQTQLANGDWELDRFYAGITATDQTDDEYTQKLFDLKKWLKHDPKSATARICLAEVYKNYAWFARGSGYADTVTSEGWKKFADRIQQAKAALATDPQIRDKCPRSFHMYSIIERVDGSGGATPLADVDACHKRWPTYKRVDFDTCYTLLPRWGGAQYDTERFIIKRADEMGGTAGDILCAQAVWDTRGYLDDLFTAQNPLKWPRVKAGFKSICAKYPQSLDARVTYFTMAGKAGDSAAELEAFDGYVPPKVALSN